MQPKPMMLIVLDGFGISKDSTYNAIAKARTPNWNHFLQQYSHIEIFSSGEDVGLPDNQMGNSEVGHINLGAGRVVYQELTRINREIRTKEFFQNPVLNEAIEKAQKNNVRLHIMGLMSSGGVHSHLTHVLEFLSLCAEKNFHNVVLHAFLDGRDTPPQSAKEPLEQIETHLKKLNLPPIATVCGRFYAMDRDNRFERTEKAYQLLTEGKALYDAPSALSGLQSAYARQENDEFVSPTVIHAHPMTENDVVVFLNFRADRARQISYALTDDGFNAFPRRIKNVSLYTLTPYADNLKAEAAYTPQSLKNTLGEFLSNHGLTQLRIAETEKYAHVTFFFNGGREEVFPGEHRILVPSPSVATYDLQPEMSAFELTDKIVTAILNQTFDAIICNFANADMVGHTGNMPACIQAIEALDICLGRIHEALLKVGGEALITADHGNAEQMFDDTTAQAHTAHTSLPVPLVYLGKRFTLDGSQHGVLSDVAPTMLTILGFTPPSEMTGRVLLKK